MTTITNKINEIVLNENEVNDARALAELLTIGLELGSNEMDDFELVMIENEMIEDALKPHFYTS